MVYNLNMSLQTNTNKEKNLFWYDVSHDTNIKMRHVAGKNLHLKPIPKERISLKEMPKYHKNKNFSYK
jgi:hypothetical protein